MGFINRSEFNLETKKLAAVLELIEKELNEMQDVSQTKKEEVRFDRKGLWEEASHDASQFDNAVEIVQHGLELHRKERLFHFSSKMVAKLQKIKHSPYFGRIDFLEEGCFTSPEQIYIGIHSFHHEETGEILIYDWRAPISSMYYDYPLGQAQYSIREGVVRGEISLKRQYKIEDGKLVYMFDSSIQIGDDLLQQMLRKNTDSKMKNIVASIQKEQNHAIRDERYQVLIVQGSAGSGKTSIALQRAAYFLYKYRESLHADQIVIFSPNQLFNAYISNVLPELGEEKLLQTTFQEYAEKALGSHIKIEDQYAQMEYLFSAKEDHDYQARVENMKYKTSPGFIKVIKNYMAYLENEGMTFTDVKLKNVIVVSQQELSRLFFDTYRSMALHHRLSHIHQYIRRAIKRQFNDIQVNRKYKHLLDDWRGVPFRQLLDCYIRLFQDEKVFMKAAEGTNLPDSLASIRMQTIHSLQHGQLLYEDVAPLLFVKGALEGWDKSQQIRQVMIDEAQDYSPMQLEIIQQMFPKARFTILGDLNQAIHPYMNSEGTISTVFGEHDTGKVELKKSYRSTREIVYFTKGLLLEELGIEAVSRPGMKPQLIRVVNGSESRLNDAIIHYLSKIKDSGLQSIAIICKTARESERAYFLLKEKLPLQLISSKEGLIKEKIVVLPSYLAKGLEFDAVIVHQVGEIAYSREIERKLLYTVTTRALHQLYMFYQGKLSSLIVSVDEEAFERQLF